MAMMDYGVMVFKNGEFINQDEFFMDMKKSVGWEDWKDVRYPDCPRIECVLGDEYSPCTQCEDCHYNPETSEYIDCKGNSFKSGDHIKGNFFAYIGDEDFTIAFYKNSCKIMINKLPAGSIWCNYEVSEKESSDGYSNIIKHMSKVWEFDKYKIHVKTIDPRVHLASFCYKEDQYHVIYGYGIDPTLRVWNKVKVRYLGKRTSIRVDRLIEKYWTKKGK